MSSKSLQSGPGGFLSPILPSPPPSSVTSPSLAPSTLPTPRAHPLKPGSPKESNFIEYVDRKLLDISGRYEKRFNVGVAADHEEPSQTPQSSQTGASSQRRGYESFAELAGDLDSVIDIVWVSGTRRKPILDYRSAVTNRDKPAASLQTPYLLNVALAISIYLPSFDFAPRRTFQLLQKLDVAFSSLLHGQNVETGEALPGFKGGRGKLTTTEKVRIRGLVERTRVAVVIAAGKDWSVDERSRVTETDENLTSDDDVMMEGTDTGEEYRSWEMDVARVYERTIVDLGAALDVSNDGALG